MDEKNFCYWLNGYFELTDKLCLDSKQVQIIKDHLALVFDKVTPKYTEGVFPLYTGHTGNSAQGLCGMTDNTAIIDKRIQEADNIQQKLQEALNTSYCVKKCDIELPYQPIPGEKPIC